MGSGKPATGSSDAKTASGQLAENYATELAGQAAARDAARAAEYQRRVEARRAQQREYYAANREQRKAASKTYLAQRRRLRAERRAAARREQARQAAAARIREAAARQADARQPPPAIRDSGRCDGCGGLLAEPRRGCKLCEVRQQLAAVLARKGGQPCGR